MTPPGSGTRILWCRDMWDPESATGAGGESWKRNSNRPCLPPRPNPRGGAEGPPGPERRTDTEEGDVHPWSETHRGLAQERGSARALSTNVGVSTWFGPCGCQTNRVFTRIFSEHTVLPWNTPTFLTHRTSITPHVLCCAYYFDVLHVYVVSVCVCLRVLCVCLCVYLRVLCVCFCVFVRCMGECVYLCVVRGVFIWCVMCVWGCDMYVWCMCVWCVCVMWG